MKSIREDTGSALVSFVDLSERKDKKVHFIQSSNFHRVRKLPRLGHRIEI